MNEWTKAQQHEKEYFTSGKNKQWQTPHSLEYWLNFLQIDKLNGIGIEAGCGPNGIYNFTSSIIGVDSINYHKQNFIHCIAEYLPFKSNSLNFAICCNSLDHCQNPQLVINEILRVTNNLVLWSNIFPFPVKWILSRTDKTHPYHFSMKDLKNLLSNISCEKQVKKSIFSWHGKHASFTGKLKLFFASLLGVKGVCLHLEMINK